MLQQPAFGRRLKSLRLARGISQAMLAGDGMSTGYLSRLESGARPPTERAVAYLAEHLGVPITAFQESEVDSLADVLATVISAADRADALDLLTAAVEADAHHNSALRWQALWTLAELRNERGDHEGELECLRQLTALSDDLGVVELRTRARVKLARCLRAMGQNEQVRETAAEALAIAREHTLSVQDVAAALLVLVSAEAEAGRLPDARAHADELCDLVKDVSGTLPAEALWSAATVRIRQGDHASAQDLLDRALDLLDSRDDLIMWMRLRFAAASLYLQATPPRTEAARVRLDEAQTALGLVGSTVYRQEFLVLQAHLAFHEGRVADARALCEQLDDGAVQLSFRDRVRLDMLRGQLLILDGRAEEGTRALRALAQEARDVLNVDLAAEIWRTLAETFAGGGPTAGRGGTTPTTR